MMSYTNVNSISAKIINNASISANGDLILKFNDGTELNAGNVVGPVGPPGPIGAAGELAEPNFGTTLVSENYECTYDDCYIGVNSDRSIIITLPPHPGDGHQIAVKIEMAELNSGQTITIETDNVSTIDGALSYTMTEPWQSAHMFSRGGDWFIV
jgi:hypothetical protein